MKMRKNIRLLPAAVILVLTTVLPVGLLLWFSDSQSTLQTHTLNGLAFGTSWSVKIISQPADVHKPSVQKHMQQILDKIDRQMSTHRSDSQISNFNQFQFLDWFPVSLDLASVVQKSLEISRITGGYFDITVYPVVRKWGFSPNHPPSQGSKGKLMPHPSGNKHPTYEDVQARLDPPALQKRLAHLQIDLSAIAKGYAVDRIYQALKGLGHTDFLVEIGGELRSSGKNGSNQFWHIGIEKPQPSARSEPAYTVILDDMAIATSGDYRNFITSSNATITHIIDPITRKPLFYGGKSVSVVARDAMSADAFATGLLAMGRDTALMSFGGKALPFLFIEVETGEILTYGNNFQKYLVNGPKNDLTHRY